MKKSPFDTRIQTKNSPWVGLEPTKRNKKLWNNMKIWRLEFGQPSSKSQPTRKMSLGFYIFISSLFWFWGNLFPTIFLIWTKIGLNTSNIFKVSILIQGIWPLVYIFTKGRFQVFSISHKIFIFNYVTMHVGFSQILRVSNYQLRAVGSGERSFVIWITCSPRPRLW